MILDDIRRCFISDCAMSWSLLALCILWSGVMDWSLGLEPWSGVLEWILGVELWSEMLERKINIYSGGKIGLF